MYQIYQIYFMSNSCWIVVVNTWRGGGLNAGTFYVAFGKKNDWKQKNAQHE